MLIETCIGATVIIITNYQYLFWKPGDLASALMHGSCPGHLVAHYSHCSGWLLLDSFLSICGHFSTLKCTVYTLEDLSSRFCNLSVRTVLTSSSPQEWSASEQFQTALHQFHKKGTKSICTIFPEPRHWNLFDWFCTKIKKHGKDSEDLKNVQYSLQWTSLYFFVNSKCQ